jgi:hypothetical protein
VFGANQLELEFNFVFNLIIHRGLHVSPSPSPALCRTHVTSLPATATLRHLPEPTPSLVPGGITVPNPPPPPPPPLRSLHTTGQPSPPFALTQAVHGSFFLRHSRPTSLHTTSTSSLMCRNRADVLLRAPRQLLPH